LLISGIALASVSTHFFLLGDAEAAGIGCALASIRNLIAIKFRGKRILAIFVLANISFFFYEWFYLNSAWIVAIAYTSSLIFTVGSILLTSAARMRQWFVLAELLGLTFAILVGSIFGTIFNITNLSSIVVMLIKDYRIHKRNKRAENSL